MAIKLEYTAYVNRNLKINCTNIIAILINSIFNLIKFANGRWHFPIILAQTSCAL
jgi:hypothetical protein